MSLSQQRYEFKDEVKREDDATHTILREMFPRQYGLPCVFNSQRKVKSEVGHYQVINNTDNS
jgi:hypothetical protein